jgi:hypothetical protein
VLQGVALCSVIRRARTERTVPTTKPRYLRTAQVAELLHVPQDGQPLGAGGQADYLRTPDQGSRALREIPSSSSSSRTGLQDAYVAPLRTQHGPRVLRRCFGKAKEQVTDLLLLVEVGRLELRPTSWSAACSRSDPVVDLRVLPTRWDR